MGCRTRIGSRLSQHIGDLHHAGRTPGGHGGTAGIFNIVFLEGADGTGQIIMVNIETAAHAAAFVRSGHLRKPASGGPDHLPGLVCDAQRFFQMTGVMIGDNLFFCVFQTGFNRLDTHLIHQKLVNVHCFSDRAVNFSAFPGMGFCKPTAIIS